MKILAVETSCDETGIALLEASGGLKSPKFKILKNLVASQIETHRPWGGVVPNLAKREHQINLPILFEKIIGRKFQILLRPRAQNRGASTKSQTNSKFNPFDKLGVDGEQSRTIKIQNSKLTPDLIAVTAGPGLEPCLWTGINFAKEIKKQYFPKIKIVGANHLHGHLFSFLLSLSQKCRYNSDREYNDIFPAIQLIVSGGHTILLYMKSLIEHKKLGETRDDAAGEAFDKVARMLGLPYPGGPEIERLAKYGSPTSINFPRPMINSKNYDFSFSGLKTAVLYYLKNQKNSETSPLKNIAASFQDAVIDVLTAKTLRAAKEFRAKSVILSGGVAANDALRHSLRAQARNCHINFLSADKKFQGDNAAIIAAAGYITHLHNKKYSLEANGLLEV